MEQAVFFQKMKRSGFSSEAVDQMAEGLRKVLRLTPPDVVHGRLLPILYWVVPFGQSFRKSFL
jgi:hypothetical protein